MEKYNMRKHPEKRGLDFGVKGDKFFKKSERKKSMPSTSSKVHSSSIVNSQKTDSSIQTRLQSSNMGLSDEIIKANDEGVKKEKKFDKKQWRLKKYSNKYKLEKWEQMRKKKMLHQYNKVVKNEPQGLDVKKIYEEHNSDDDEDEERSDNVGSIKESNTPVKNEEFSTQQDRVGRVRDRKVYSQMRNERFKKLNRKTKKGQPIMKDRLEMLLEKIQQSCQE